MSSIHLLVWSRASEATLTFPLLGGLGRLAAYTTGPDHVCVVGAWPGAAIHILFLLVHMWVAGEGLGYQPGSASARQLSGLTTSRAHLASSDREANS
jgi:hypothetical protein